MGEWALPPEEGRAFTETLDRDRAEGRPEVRWMRGASWRNFQVKYREVNDLHKQMLRTSGSAGSSWPGPARVALDHPVSRPIQRHLLACLFGGIYLSHMRLATYAHLIAAEDLADAAAGRLHAAERRDLDLDGIDEVRLASAGQVVSVDLAEGAGIGGWDIRPVRHALCAVLRRRPEAYHQTLRDHESALAAAAANPVPAAAATDAAPVSIHEQFLVKEPGLAELLHYDPYERRSGLVRFLAPGTSPEAWAQGSAVELGDAVDGPFAIESLELDRLVVTRDATVVSAGDARATVRRPRHPGAAVRVTKSLVLGGDRRSPALSLRLTVTNRSAVDVEAILGLEWTITMLGGGNPVAWLQVSGVRMAHDARGSAAGVTEIGQGNDDVGIAVATAISPPADAWWAPVETISNSEGGFERVYQGAGLLLSWPISLAGGESRTVTVGHM